MKFALFNLILLAAMFIIPLRSVAGGDLPFPLDEAQVMSVQTTWRTQTSGWLDTLKIQILQNKSNDKMIRILGPSGELYEAKPLSINENGNYFVEFSWARVSFKVIFPINLKSPWIEFDGNMYELFPSHLYTF